METVSLLDYVNQQLAENGFSEFPKDARRLPYEVSILPRVRGGHEIKIAKHGTLEKTMSDANKRYLAHHASTPERHGTYHVSVQHPSGMIRITIPQHYWSAYQLPVTRESLCKAA